MRRVQTAAHLGEFLRIADDILGMVPDGARIGHFVPDPAETDAEARPVGHIIPGPGRRNAGLEHLAGDQHLVQRLLDHPRAVQFEHHVGVAAMVETHPVGPFAGILVIRQVDPYCFQFVHGSVSRENPVHQEIELLVGIGVGQL